MIAFSLDLDAILVQSIETIKRKSREVEWEGKEESCCITGWDIQVLINDEKSLEAAKLDWTIRTKNHPVLDVSCTQQDLDKEVEWVEALFTDVLNTDCKKVRVTPFSKRWLNKEVAEARKTWAKEKKLWGKVLPNRENLKRAQNLFYCTVRKAKRECWQKFLMGEKNLRETWPKYRQKTKIGAGKH